MKPPHAWVESPVHGDEQPKAFPYLPYEFPHKHAHLLKYL